jgi:pSer/pThr/pTyr-binding forkhead associated (FHA) protein
MKLVIEDETGTRTVVPFSADELTLGRSREGMSWRLPARNVSRRHARFIRTSGAVFVEDLGSRTGTWLNGERIGGRRRVRAGDLVEVGDYDLVVVAEGLEPIGTAPPPLPPLVEVVGSGQVAARTAAPRSRLLGRAALMAGAALLGGLLLGRLLARLAR